MCTQYGVCPRPRDLSTPPTATKGEYPGISVRNIVGVICNNAATPTPHTPRNQPKVVVGPENYLRLIERWTLNILYSVHWLVYTILCSIFYILYSILSILYGQLFIRLSVLHIQRSYYTVTNLRSLSFCQEPLRCVKQ